MSVQELLYGGMVKILLNRKALNKLLRNIYAFKLRG